MKAGLGSSVADVDPIAAWTILSSDADARLVDVRSRPEWGFVGGPVVAELGQEVIQIEWQTFPGMTRNTAFVAELAEALAGHNPSQLLFLCRSGVRSMHAAQAVLDSPWGGGISCINIAGGFEGDLNEKGQRAKLNGWKVSGLPWRQS